MKKICFVDYDMTITGGAERVAANLANSLINDFQVFFISINEGSGVPAFFLDKQVIYHSFLSAKTRLREMITGFYKPFRRFMRENQIDVVLLMGNYPALIALCARLGVKAKFVYCDHGALVNQWHQKDITMIRRFNTLLCDKLVVLTEQTKKDYISRFHTSEKKVDYIYNWIPDELMKNSTVYDGESQRILSAGRLSYEKGYDLLVKVAKEVLPQHPQWHWDIFGEGPEKDKIVKWIAENGLQEQLHLMGNSSDMYQLYPHYSMLVMTSYREGLPLSLLEAKAFKLPTVSFDCMTGPAEIIQDGVDGFLIPPYDIQKMAGKINALISDANLRKSCSDGTQGNIGQFAKERILAQWTCLLSDLCNHN